MIARNRIWAYYAAAWVPLGLYYAMLMERTARLPRTYARVITTEQALIQGLTYVVPAALLGAAVWWISGRLTWPPRRLWGFLVAHVGLAIAFALLWLGAEVTFIASQTGLMAAIEISKAFAGFQALDGIFFYGLIAAGSYAIRMASRLREQEARAARADTLRMRAELAALRGQLNPHFLFNTLHTLTALVQRDPQTAERALERFGDMLRYVLDAKRSAREDVTLGDELQFVRDYLSLEQLRLGDRLSILERVDSEAFECMLPSLTLQPLVENAIKHGIAPRARGGTIEIVAQLEDESLVLEVRDNGSGAPRGIVETATGVGVRAVRQRLETRYGRRASFAVTTAPGEGFVVRLSLPAHTTAEAIPASASA